MEKVKLNILKYSEIKDHYFDIIFISLKKNNYLLEQSNIIISDTNIVLCGNRRVTALIEQGKTEIEKKYIKKYSELSKIAQFNFDYIRNIIENKSIDIENFIDYWEIKTNDNYCLNG